MHTDICTSSNRRMHNRNYPSVILVYSFSCCIYKQIKIIFLAVTRMFSLRVTRITLSSVCGYMANVIFPLAEICQQQMVTSLVVPTWTGGPEGQLGGFYHHHLSEVRMWIMNYNRFRLCHVITRQRYKFTCFSLIAVEEWQGWVDE